MSKLHSRIAFVVKPSTVLSKTSDTLMKNVSSWLEAPISVFVASDLANLHRNIESESVELVVFAPSAPVRLDASEVIFSLLDRLTIPVLLFPPRTSSTVNLSSLVVPIGVEQVASTAATTAFAWAEHIRRPVDLIRVGCTSEYCECETSLLDSYSDSFHHEYLPRIASIVNSVSPHSSREEKQWVRDTCHCCCEHILDIVRRFGARNDVLLVFEWSSELFRPDFSKLEAALNEAACKLLFVKPGARSHFTLKVGKNFFAA